MSGNDNTNWDDHLDFESLADEHDAELGVSESGGGASDLTDLSYDSDPGLEEATSSGEPAEQATDKVPESSSKVEAGADNNSRKSKRAQVSYKRSSGVPAVIMGFLFGFSALVSGLGLGWAVLLVSGMDIKSLWNPEALFQVGPWFNLENNPLHVLYLVGLGILFLAVLISWRVLTFSRVANRNLGDTEEVLGKLINLRLDNESAWQNPIFKRDQAVESFVFEILGAWRLQVARQDKNLTLEGELRRLEKAVTENSKDDLASGYDHPILGQLSDQMVRLYEEKEAAIHEIQDVRAKDQNESGSIIGVIQDARSWNRHTLDKLGVQGSAIERIAQSLAEASEESGSAEDGSSRMPQISLTLRELRTELEKMAAATLKDKGADHSGVAAHFTDLVDRVGKLAFQIAMEVANLGTRGERLLPMAQALEELTTEFRESTGQITEATSSSAPLAQTKYQDMARKIEGMIGILDSPPDEIQPSLLSGKQDLAQAAGTVSTELENIAGSFNLQAERLSNLGVEFAALTGATFDSGNFGEGKKDIPVEGTMEVSQMDPFVQEIEEPQPVTEADPFSPADEIWSSNDETAKGVDFSSDVTPVQENFASSSPSEPEPTAVADPVLSPEEEKVYDLSEFGAVLVSGSSPGAEPEDRIYDLAEFGAVGLD